MLNKYLVQPLVSLLMLFTLSSCAVYNTDIDRKIGAQNSQQVAQQMGLYEQQPIAGYVQSVGQRLVAQLEKPEFTFQFHIVDDATPNAFALPGGYIYISRGLLALMSSEDELANVLAHEIIHVTERHSVKQMRSGILPRLIELPGNLVGGIVNENLGNLINAPISAGNDLLLSGYGRGHETQSDEKGIALAAKAGYQPQQMVDILVRLNKAVELSTQQKRQKSYFDSHPYTPDRVAHINQQMVKLAIKPTPHLTTNFMGEIDGLLYGENPAKGLFVGNQFLHPALGFVMDFPENWTQLNQPQAVIAVDQKANTFIALSMVDNKNNALQNAQQFQQQLQNEMGTTVDYQTIRFDWGGTGYQISLPNDNQSEPYTAQLLWVDMQDVTYQISSMAKASLTSLITASSSSLRPILESEKQTLTGKQIQVVTPQKNESLQALIAREKNLADINYIALINDIDTQQILTRQQSIKIVTKRPRAQ